MADKSHPDEHPNPLELLAQECKAMQSHPLECKTNHPNAPFGLIDQYAVRRLDGSSEPGGKHHGCEYFVLDVNHDPYAIPALIAYANAVEATHPVLAADVRERYGLERRSGKHQNSLTTDLRRITFGGCPFCGSQSCVAGECRHNGKTLLIPDVKK